MKTLAKILAGITILVVAILAYLILSSGLSLKVDVNTVSAAQNLPEYVQRAGSEEGSTEHSIVYITVEAKNRSLIPAEWAQLNFGTLDGDLVAYDLVGGPVDIPAFGSETFSVTLITSNPAPRSIWVSYYLAGRESISE